MTTKANQTFYLSEIARAYLAHRARKDRRTVSDWMNIFLEDMAEADSDFQIPTPDSGPAQVTAAA